MTTFQRADHTFDYPRYLQALKPVSARAQHPTLKARFLDALEKRATSIKRPLQVLEIGAGRGDQMEWVLNAAHEQGISVQYHAIEPHAENRAIIQEKATHHGQIDADVSVHGVPFFDFAARAPSGAYDVVLARSVLDLMDLDKALSAIAKLTSEFPLIYAPLTFSLVTRFAPALPDSLSGIEHRITKSYHQVSRQKTNIKKSDYTAHKMLSWALDQTMNATMKASDWVISPVKQGYKNDEQYVLESILAFMYDEAQGADCVSQSQLDAWWDARHQMVHNARLIYTANQFDVLIGEQPK